MRRIPLILLTSLVSLLAGSVSLKAQPIHVMDYTNKVWNVWTNGTDPGYGVTAGSPDWAQKTFDDTAWPTGVGLFGNDGTVYAPYGFTTVTPPPSVAIRFYARTHFTWSGSPVGVVLTGTNFIDDGAVIYLNGVEIYRYNMPAGPTTFDTLAPAANPAPFGEPSRVPFDIALDTLTANPLVAGDNVIAVETASNASSSSDTVWAMSLFAGQSIAPCTDGIQPTNRAIIVGRSTTFTVVEQCAIPPATILWYRNVGAGEEQILDSTLTPVTGASYTLSNAVPGDAGVYYARLTNTKGTVDSRQAVLTVNPDLDAPRFLLASVVGPGLNTFRLTTDEQLCSIATDCGSDFTFQFNWQINESLNTANDLGVATITMITPTLYEFTTSNPRDPTKQYQITVLPIFGEVSDLFGNFVPPGTFAETLPQASFQQGDANGYAGTHDTEVRQNTPDDNTLGSRDFFNVDQSDNTIGGGTAGPVNGLIRFDNIFGNSPTQVPPGSTIVSVQLVLSSSQANANGNPIDLHRMLIPWDESTTTWNSTVNGINPDGTEASVTPDADNFNTALTVPFVITLDSATYPGMLDTVQAWANGTPNYGWALLPTGTDGYRVDSSEALSVATHPMLVIEYRPVTCSGPPVIVAQPPATVSANELQSFSITVGVSNACDATLQWTRNGTDITGANGSTYTVSSARPAADGGSYRLRVTSPGGTVTSAASVVTVAPKTTHPHVTRVVSSANGTTITVAFNEAVSTASAQNTANYTLTPAVTVSGAVLGANNTVTLTTAARSVSTAYSLRIANVTDIAETPNAIAPNPTIVSLTSASVVAGAEWNSTWLYNSNNLDSTAGAWKDTGYTPGADWGTGPALFGAETGAAGSPPAAPTTIGTPLTPNSVAATSEELVTTYFRKSITLPALPAGGRYVICHYTDDGFIAYLDGAEIYRFGMPAGAVTFTNRSTGIPTGDATMRSFSFTSTAGAHTLAVELHQAGVTTSDVLFGMEVHVLVGAAPSLSISHAAGGPVDLSWSADGSWRLRGSAGVTGPYLDVAIPATNPLGTFSLPSGSVTNRNFWLLDYVCPP